MIEDREFDVDVIVPFHRIDRMLFDSLKSVSASVGVSVRLVLVADFKNGSFQSSQMQELKDFLDSFNCTYLLVPNQSGGYAHAFAEAKPLLEAPFTALMNSDDLVSPQRFMSQKQVLEESGADICVGRLIKFFGSTKVKVPFMSGSLGRLGFVPSLLLCGPFGADASWFLRREIFLRDFSLDPLVRSSDWKLAIELNLKLEFVFDSKAEYFYRLHHKQVTSQRIHHDSFFREIYPTWLVFNNRYQLPVLKLSDAAFISAPTSNIQLEKGWRRRLGFWIQAYASLFSPGDWMTVKEILLRRFLLRGKFPPPYLLSARGVLSFLWDILRFACIKLIA